MKSTNGNVNGKSNRQGTMEHSQLKPYTMLVSTKFIVLSLAASILLAFGVGRGARILLIDEPRKALFALQNTIPPNVQVVTDSHSQKRDPKILPAPVMQEGKEFPRTIYTSKNFDTGASATSSSLLVQRPRNDSSRKRDEDGSWIACDVEGSETCDHDSQTTDHGKEEEEHLPAGQHLLVDFKNVDSDFLDDEERLAQAMVDVARESQLTLLSYHCHGLEPTGVSCAGVLLESHVSFHTWPEEGVITFDLFTCGSGLLVPVLPIVVRLFGIPQEPDDDDEEDEDEIEPPTYIWAHKLRGFRNNNRNYLARDLGRDIYSVIDYDMKVEVASTDTDFQKIHVYDVINPRFHDLATYKSSLVNNGSYESRNPELFQPDRIVYLDGVMQSSRLGDEAYHEALVHPGMFAHPNPRRVAIIGGGEGATLREVLKHNTIDKVVMIEIDELMVSFSRDNLPSWNTCADIVGSTPSCFDDKRADVYYEDALKWFIDRFFNISKSDGSNQAERFDVIIMDALDPQDNVAFANALYQNNVFLTSLYNALTDDGVILMQLGESPDPLDPAEELSIDKNRAKIVELLEQAGMKAMHVYEEFHSDFQGAWSHLVACKDQSCDLNWYATPAEVELAIHQRLLRTHSRKSSLKFFDGATMGGYQVPHKVFENVYCRKIPVPQECHLFLNHRYNKNIPVTDFELKEISAGEETSRGVFAKVDIPKGSNIGLENAKSIIHIPSWTFKTFLSRYHSLDKAKDLKVLKDFIDSYGYAGDIMGPHGEEEHYVDTSILTFVNNGCNVSNIGHFSDCKGSECEVHFHMKENLSPYSPHYKRHKNTLINGFDLAFRDIHAGEEILIKNSDVDGERQEGTC